MRRAFFLLLTLTWLAPGAHAAPDPQLEKALSDTYRAWRQAMIDENPRQWQALTARHRQMEVRNRLVSEKRPFPAGVFRVPAPPPTLEGLRCVNISQRGPTAKGAWYGPVNFGVGGNPTDNFLVLSFVQEQGRWKYDRADFVNLAGLPEVRKEIEAGDLSYLEQTPDFLASGQVPRAAPPVPQAKYIAKVYVFCPFREVEVQINQVSRHSFANAKEAEVVHGGARDGRNDVVYTIKPLPGGTGKEALTIRVYLMSEIQGQKPIKAFEYLVNEGEPVDGYGKGTFNLDRETAAKLVPTRR